MEGGELREDRGDVEKPALSRAQVGRVHSSRASPSSLPSSLLCPLSSSSATLHSSDARPTAARRCGITAAVVLMAMSTVVVLGPAAALKLPSPLTARGRSHLHRSSDAQSLSLLILSPFDSLLPTAVLRYSIEPQGYCHTSTSLSPSLLLHSLCLCGHCPLPPSAASPSP